jgi:hypothetical protein
VNSQLRRRGSDAIGAGTEDEAMKPKPMRVAHVLLWLASAGLSTILLPGCAGDAQDQNAQVRVPRINEQEIELSADTAKKALLEMDMRAIRPGVIVPAPTADTIDFFEAGEFRVGRWTCDLKKRTFYVYAEFPNAARHRFNEVSGIFERNADGKWVAKVTTTESGH